MTDYIELGYSNLLTKEVGVDISGGINDSNSDALIEDGAINWGQVNPGGNTPEAGATNNSAQIVNGNFIGDLINARFDTSTKEILGDFTFGASGAIQMTTDASNGLWISPTGILGKKAGTTTFSIGIDGAATFAGTLVSASGTFGTITAGSISGVTITGSTLQTGTSGANVNITTSRLSVRNDSTETLYLELGTHGGTFGLKNLSGNSIFQIVDRDASNNIGIYSTLGDMFFSTDTANKDYIFVGGTGHDVYPATDAQTYLGLGSNRWADVQSVLINGADYSFENDWYLTESYKVGIKEDGLAILNSKNELIMFVGESSFYAKDVKDVNKLPYVKTTLKQRAQMDMLANTRAVRKDFEIVDIPDPKDAKIGGSIYKEKKQLIKKNNINLRK
eukprot:GHVR01065522.1.p1 GENE.GHVR01065522.1~~GHVR01065522.1.p1  ORF type:complete len:391 (+),score=70.85 GHVR01065522.1:195-1367(+)